MLKDDYMIAFSCVTFFEADLISHINTTTARESLFRIITNTLENKNAMYATAIMNLGYTPCTVVSNANYSKGGWNVKGGRSGGSLALRDALAHSQNAVA
ncbi:hypothetical protein HAV29_20110, partial [Elizabethkingia miricola]|nr:hypothetical protein [Elizabethkingia miricola]